MQNKYVGDEGDFVKYGLLRRLTCPEFTNSPLSLGVIWYLFDDENNQDGKKIGYLKDEKNRQCDAHLFDILQRIVSGKRDVSAIEQSGIFPSSTAFFSDILSFEGMESYGEVARHQRLKHRSDWVKKGLKLTCESEIVFFDPDNGLEIRSKKKHHKKAPKYVYWDEIAPFQERERKQSVVIYQHCGRNGKHDEQIRKRFKQAKEQLRYGKNAIALRYGSRAFIIVPTDDHRDAIDYAVKNLLNSPWGDTRRKHFKKISKNSASL